ncbi:hypothetical protein [Endothiovibrio diazotrophicus]
MTRTIVNIADDDKAWLERRAAEEHVPMTEVVRRAVRYYRQSRERIGDFDALLDETSGSWAGEDGLAYQVKSRDEWER